MSGLLNSIYNNITYALNRQTGALLRLQEQAATGSRINRPSDDPSGGYQILTLENEKDSLEKYIKTLDYIVGTLEVSFSLLQQINSTINKARVSITQITSGVYDQQSREMTADEINDYLEQLVQLANTKHNGLYLFGGSDTDSAPYAIERSDGEIISVTYQGGSQQRDVNVAPGVTASAVYVGQELFSSNQRSTPVFLGSTGAAAGTGTSSVTGDVWLTVTFDGTNYQLSIDDGLSYETVPTGGNANQKVTDSRTGQVLYVDTTGINAVGVELVRVEGTYNVFDTLISIRDILRNDRSLSDEQLAQYRNATINSLEELKDLLVGKEVSVGSKVEYLDDLKAGLEAVKANNEDSTSRLEQADIARIAIDLSRQEVLYQMSLSVAGKLLSMSLLDFIE